MISMHSSSPEIFLSYVAAKTKNIRLGHGITLTPHRYNHPIRIAERIATLDILSDGRVNWGSGKSSSLVEMMAFESDIPKLGDQWEEALEMIPQMWQQDVFEWKGRHFNIPPTQVIPKPVQKPHPPMFAACTRPSSAPAVGAMGIGALNFAFGDDEYLSQKVKEYKTAVAKAKPKNYKVTDFFGCTLSACVLNDDKKAVRYGARGARFFGEALSIYYMGRSRPTGDLKINRSELSDKELENTLAMREKMGAQMAAVMGDPMRAREAIERFQKVGVDECILIMQMGTVPNDIVLESVKTFGEKVIPHFK